MLSFSELLIAGSSLPRSTKAGGTWRRRLTGWAAIALTCIGWSIGTALAGTAIVAGIAPTENTDGTPLTDLAAYKLYWRCGVGTGYPESSIYPPAFPLNVTGLPDAGTCYFVATAINSLGRESVFSNESSKLMGPSAPPGKPSVFARLLEPGLGMAVAINNLANDIDTSRPYSTESLSWTAGSRGIVFIASAVEGGGTITNHSVSGGDVTWTEIVFIVYGARRGLSVFVSDDTPANGVLTFDTDWSGAVAFQEAQWSVSELTGFDSAQWPSTGTEAAVTSGTTINAPDVGTIDTGDMVVFGVGFEGATDDLAVAAGSSQHILRQSGSNVRSLLVGTSTTDDTPGATFTTSGNSAGIVAVLIKADAGGGGDPEARLIGGKLLGGGLLVGGALIN